MAFHKRSIERIIALTVVLVLVQPAGFAKGGSPWDEHIQSARNSLAYGDFQKAESEMQLAMEDTRKFKDNDLRLGETFYQMGELHVRLQNYTLAKQYFERALNVQQRLLGAQSLEAANSLYGISLCCQQLGDHLAAEIFLKRVDEIWRKKLGADKSKLISILPSMGTYASMKNNLPQAEQYYRELVDLEAAQPSSSPRYGDHLNLLATTLGAQGKYGEAKEFATKAVAYLKKNSDSSIAIDSAEDNLRIVERQASGKIIGTSDTGENKDGKTGDKTDVLAFSPVPFTPPVPRTPANPIPTTTVPVNRTPSNAGTATRSPSNPVTETPARTPSNPTKETPARTPSNPTETPARTPSNPTTESSSSTASPKKGAGSAVVTTANKKTPSNPFPPDEPSSIKRYDRSPSVNIAQIKTEYAKNDQIASAKINGNPNSVGLDPNVLKPWQTNQVIKKNDGKDSKHFGKVRYLAEGRLITPEEYKALLLATEAYEMMRAEKYRMAADVLAKALDIYPELPSAHTNIGLALARLGQTDEAIEHLKVAISLDPTRSAPWVNLASSFQTSGRLKDCVETYQEYLRRFPNDSLASKASELVKHIQEEVNEQSSVEKSLAVTHETGKNDYFAYTTAGGTLKWSPNHSPIKVHIGNGARVPGYKTEFQGIMNDAFNNWALASQDKVKFEFVPKPEGADIECVWTNDYSQVNSPAEGGEAQVHSNANGITHVKIVILTADPTPDSPLNQNQVRAVCLHEIGHSLGLIGHSPNPGDIMYCTMPSVDSKIAISARDIDTMRKLYSPEVHIAMRSNTRGPAGIETTASATEPATVSGSHAYAQTIEQLESVLKADPANDEIKEKLSKAYNEYAQDLAAKGKEQDAESFMRKAMTLQSGIRNAAVKLMTLRNYANLLHKLRRDKEAEQVEAQAKSIN